MSRSIEILALPDGQIPCFGFGDASSLDQVSSRLIYLGPSITFLLIISTSMMQVDTGFTHY
jgi:hypothetical protein